MGGDVRLEKTSQDSAASRAVVYYEGEEDLACVLPLRAPLQREQQIPGSIELLLVAFKLPDSMEPDLKLVEKYSDVPMSLADACLVRMTETLADPVILTTDQDFRAYRRHSR
jgi:hypothetical protein